MQNVQSQDVDLHSLRWKNRMFLIISDDSNNEKHQLQLHELLCNEAGLEERKLLIIEVHKNKYKANYESKEWRFSNSLYKKYANSDSTFQNILIGLDGGVKINEFEILTAEAIFREIDSMPMRMSELRKLKN